MKPAASSDEIRPDEEGIEDRQGGGVPPRVDHMRGGLPNRHRTLALVPDRLVVLEVIPVAGH